MMKIEIITPPLSSDYWQLLLEADPNQKLIESYLGQATFFQGTVDGHVVAVLALVAKTPKVVEIMNLCVDENYREQHFAQQMLKEAINWSKARHFQQIEIATGSTGLLQLYLYQKLGFRMWKIVPDYFLTHYPEQIIENGLVLKDQVGLRLTF
ncbi:GNAT family N-acetyltransferase [Enterococcus timonensis]|uniref:GNAT family N-acetyltransferase n=1 Tax=Enterococcus timonensis TaxID=1852364 RepID=UPI001F42C9C5|nr:GNAT family N-acetyltransferase [Enterococcus timonensis]